LQVEPAAQSEVLFPLHATWHGVVPPHSTWQLELPVHATLQPPFGHWIEQVLLPPQLTVAAGPRMRLHRLPPLQVVVLDEPVVKLH
jgi:hypothetical protein